MSRVNQTQTRNPSSSIAMRGLNPKKKYILVQVSEPGVYKSPIGKYLDAESPTHPGETMLTVRADGTKKGDEHAAERVLAGGEDMMMLEYRYEEDRAHVLKHGHPAFSADGVPTGWKDALDREARVEGTREKDFEGTKGQEFETVQGGVLAAT